MGITVHPGWPPWFTSNASALFQLIFEAILEGNGVVWYHLKNQESWNMTFLDFLRDKKRFVLKTFSRLKSINLFYLGTSSKDEITELRWWSETSQISWKQDSGYFHGRGRNETLSVALCPAPRPQGHHFCVILGARLAGWDAALALATAQQTCCKRQQGWFGGVFLGTWPWPLFHSCTWQAVRRSLGLLSEASLRLLSRPFQAPSFFEIPE